MHFLVFFIVYFLIDFSLETVYMRDDIKSYRYENPYCYEIVSYLQFHMLISFHFGRARSYWPKSSLLLRESKEIFRKLIFGKMTFAQSCTKRTPLCTLAHYRKKIGKKIKKSQRYEQVAKKYEHMFYVRGG